MLSFAVWWWFLYEGRKLAKRGGASAAASQGDVSARFPGGTGIGSHPVEMAAWMPHPVDTSTAALGYNNVCYDADGKDEKLSPLQRGHTNELLPDRSEIMRPPVELTGSGLVEAPLSTSARSARYHDDGREVLFDASKHAGTSLHSFRAGPVPEFHP